VLVSVPITTSAKQGPVGATIAFCLAITGYLAVLSADGRDRLRIWGRLVTLWQSKDGDERGRGPDTRALAASGRRFASFAEAHAFASRDLPFSLSHTYGGHTSCVELDTGSDEYFVCDMGSGARAFGEHILARQAGRPATVNVFMSHVHWDHIMGFPFFGPAYVRGTRIRIHGCHDIVERAFRLQQSPPCFPVSFDHLGATIEFIRIPSGQPTEVSGLRVTPQLQRHSGDSYGFRFEHGGRHIVYSTDSEHKLEDNRETQRMVAFFRGADLVIFDAMYSLADAISVKEDWGHSSNVMGVELCQLAGVKHLCMFHHEPVHDDARLADILRETRRLEEITRRGARLEITSAYDGLEIAV